MGTPSEALSDTDESSDAQPLASLRGITVEVDESIGLDFDPRRYLLLEPDGIRVSPTVVTAFDEKTSAVAAEKARAFSRSKPHLCPRGFDPSTHVRPVAGGGVEPDMQAIINDAHLSHDQKVDVYRWASHCTPASLQDGVALADMPAAVSNALASAARSPIFIGVAAILCVCVLAGAAITISLTTGHDDGGTQAGHYETVQVNSTQLSAILEDVRRHYPQITPSDDWSNVADWINRLPEAARETVPFNTTEGFFQNQWVRSLGQALEPTTALFLAATLLALQALLLS